MQNRSQYHYQRKSHSMHKAVSLNQWPTIKLWSLKAFIQSVAWLSERYIYLQITAQRITSQNQPFRCILYMYTYLGKYTMYSYMGSCKQFLRSPAVGWVFGSSGFKCLSLEVASWLIRSQHFAGICTSGVQFFPLQQIVNWWNFFKCMYETPDL